MMMMTDDDATSHGTRGQGVKRPHKFT